MLYMDVIYIWELIWWYQSLLITWFKHGYVIAPVIKCGMKLLILSPTPSVATAHPKIYALYDDDDCYDDDDDDDDVDDDDGDEEENEEDHPHLYVGPLQWNECQFQVIICSSVLINNAMPCFSLAVISRCSLRIAIWSGESKQKH